ncbi:hypothetical protein H9X96_04165 [Pedobacter sp. N36a]|uniref:hypothetical protein n=1 Tax=Pedobacter sp. N36a TaxID=2767996 RepID=UPI0016572834|nr:hypothetical protein [Pedobacter sp. N36a]MBC8984966.1 hypothetical protein [Pedobacter sp. N36a]
MIDIKDFKQSLKDQRLPADLPSYLKALWYDGTGNWKTAHDVIDQLTDPRSAHIHAYLHRKEGDIWNADYWYKRAGKKRPELSLEKEWEMLIKEYCL